MIVAVVGAAPGVGKSTLCAALAAELAGHGLTVDLFREEEVLTRPAFARVADGFRSGGEVALPTFRAAVAEWAGSVDVDVVVADALVPFVPSMLIWGHAEHEVAAFHAELAGVLAPVVLYVDGDVDVALARAEVRGGPEWLPWFVEHLLAVPDRAAAVAWLRWQRDVTLRVLPWPLHVLPPGRPEEVLQAALAVLDPLLPEPGRRPGPGQSGRAGTGWRGIRSEATRPRASTAATDAHAAPNEAESAR